MELFTNYLILKEEALTNDKKWPQVLQIQLRIASSVGIVVTLMGAAMYDVNVMGNIAEWSGLARPESTQDM